MRSFAAMLLPLLAGCPQILGLDNTVLDAPIIDAPSVCDGAPACTSVNGRSVCGQLFGTGAAANAPLRVANFTGDTCAATSTEGPCGLAVAAYPLAAYFDGTKLPKVDGQIDDCGRYAVGDVDAATADVAIELTGPNFQTTVTLLLGRPPGIGEDRDVAAFAVSTATTAAWATQMSPTTPPETTTGYLISYTAATVPLTGEAVAIDGMSAIGTNPALVPWAGYFGAGSAFGALDPTLTSTGDTGTAFTVLPAGTFGLEGFRMGARCKRLAGLKMVANTLIHAHLDEGC